MRRQNLLFSVLLLIAFMGAAFITVSGQDSAWAQAQQVGSDTGLKLPRFVSLKSGRVNVRVGPGRQYDVVWTYQRAGLPVEIIAEYDNWRKIRDSEGDEGWIYHGLLSGRRTVLVTPWETETPTNARASDRSSARTTLLLEPQVLGDVEECTSNWCRIAGFSDGEEWRGWVEKNRLWGVYPDEEIE
jgi:SH3-like domain-containing protein